MTITIESTDIITTFNGATVRQWTGTTESGVRCTLYVAGVQVSTNETPGDIAQFERELKEIGIPRELKPLGAVFNLREIL